LGLTVTPRSPASIQPMTYCWSWTKLQNAGVSMQPR